MRSSQGFRKIVTELTNVPANELPDLVWEMADTLRQIANEEKNPITSKCAAAFTRVASDLTEQQYQYHQASFLENDGETKHKNIRS